MADTIDSKDSGSLKVIEGKSGKQYYNRLNKTPISRSARIKEGLDNIKRGEGRGEPCEVDWYAVHAEYRTGLYSNAELGRDYGVSDNTIHARASKEGWTRDLSGRIKDQAMIRLRDPEFRRELGATELNVMEEHVVDQESEIMARVIERQRDMLNKATSLAMSLLEDIAAMTYQKEDFRRLGELVASEDPADSGKRIQIYKRAINTQGRTATFKQATDALKVLIELERKVFGLEDAELENDIKTKGGKNNLTIEFVQSGK